MKKELQHQRELYNQAQSEIQYLLSQKDKLISKIIKIKTPDINVATPTVKKQFYNFYTKFLPRFTKQLLISDSTYKLVNQNDISNEAAIHSYPSSTIQDLGNIANNYARTTEAECLIVHT